MYCFLSVFHLSNQRVERPPADVYRRRARGVRITLSAIPHPGRSHLGALGNVPRLWFHRFGV